MIPYEILILVGLLIFVTIIINLNIYNAKKIRRNEDKKKEQGKSEKQEKVQVDDGNYLHEIFNKKGESNKLEKPIAQIVELKETQSSDIKNPVKLVPIRLKELSNAPEKKVESAVKPHFSTPEDFDEDYAIGIDADDHQIAFDNELSQEFEMLSPSMKAFILTNVMKSKDKKNDIDNLK